MQSCSHEQKKCVGSSVNFNLISIYKKMNVFHSVSRKWEYDIEKKKEFSSLIITRKREEKSETPQLCIAYVWFTSANVISLKVWSITKIVINSNCDNVTMTEKINERSAYNALYSHERTNQPKKTFLYRAIVWYAINYQ